MGNGMGEWEWERGMIQMTEHVAGCRQYAKGVVVAAAKRSPKRPVKTGNVDYGKDWYQQTRQNARRFKTVKEELAYYRNANWEANNGRERKDLYTGMLAISACCCLQTCSCGCLQTSGSCMQTG